MAYEKWQARLEKSAANNAALICASLLAVQLLSVIRDYIVIDVLPISLDIINVIVALVLAWLVFKSYWRRVLPGSGNKFAMAGLLAFGFKALAIIYIEVEPYPFIVGVLMFSLGLCYLSQFYLLITAAIIFVCWIGVALMVLPTVQIVATGLVMVIGTVMAIYVLDRRLEGLAHIYALEKRVEDLETILPMCAGCKKTRDANGEWRSIEAYIEHEKEVRVSHGMCPECMASHYPEYSQQLEEKRAARTKQKMKS